MEGVYKTVAIAAAVAFVTAVSIVGAALAVGKIGSAALGAAAEKPELLTKAILYVALAEGLAVLGFAVAMMLMNKM
jgi:V/A-type H+-transporting ATPase subunit K